MSFVKGWQTAGPAVLASKPSRRSGACWEILSQLCLQADVDEDVERRTSNRVESLSLPAGRRNGSSTRHLSGGYKMKFRLPVKVERVRAIT